MVRKKVSDGLLTFDEDSPLFAKKKTRKRSPRKQKSTVQEDILPVETTKETTTTKRTSRKAARKIPINPNVPKYTIRTPDDCKHILPAFKKLMAKKWKELETGNLMEAEAVASYIRGVAGVAKEKRPKEYEELKLLIIMAKQSVEDRKKL